MGEQNVCKVLVIQIKTKETKNEALWKMKYSNLHIRTGIGEI